MVSLPSHPTRRRQLRRGKRNNGAAAAAARISPIVLYCFCACCVASFLGVPNNKVDAFSLVPPTTPLARFQTTTERKGASRARHRAFADASTNANASANADSPLTLLMAPRSPQTRQPRRMMKKRTPKEGDRRRRRRHASEAGAKASPGGVVPRILGKGGSNGRERSRKSAAAAIRSPQEATQQEYRPLVPSVRRVMGEDYWIDPSDLEKEQKRIEQQQQKQRENGAGSSKKGYISQEKLMTEVKAPYRQNWIGYFSLMVAVLSILVSQFPELLEPAPTMRFPDL